MNGPTVRLLHALPGRVRLKVDTLKGDPPLGEEIERKVSDLEGIQSVQANPSTGSVLVLFDAERLELCRLHPSVSQALGLPAAPSVEHWQQERDDALARCRSLEGALGTANARIAALEHEAADAKERSAASLQQQEKLQETLRALERELEELKRRTKKKKPRGTMGDRPPM